MTAPKTLTERVRDLIAFGDIAGPRILEQRASNISLLAQIEGAEVDARQLDPEAELPEDRQASFAHAVTLAEEEAYGVVEAVKAQIKQEKSA